MKDCQTRRSSRLLCYALAAATLAAGPAAAFSGGSDGGIQAEGRRVASRTIFVSTANLDLASADARRILDDRVQRAAKRVCGYRSDDDLQEVGDYLLCRDQALNEAREEIERLATSRSAARGLFVRTAGR